MSKELLTIDELAEAIKVPKNTIYYWVSRSDIPYLKIGKHLRFQLTNIIKYFNDKHASKASCMNWDKYVDSGSSSLAIELDKSSGLHKGGLNGNNKT